MKLKLADTASETQTIRTLTFVAADGAALPGYTAGAHVTFDLGDLGTRSYSLVDWSGDAIQAQADNPNIDYVQPEQGCLLWSDNMSIPVGAPNAPAAYAFMDYVYEPKNMAQIVEWVNYISPVEGVRPILEKQDPALADNELIFPTEEFTADCSSVDSPPGSPEDVRDVERAWQAVLAG